MNSKQNVWRRVRAILMTRTPLLSYGELVLRPVTVAERRASGIPLRATAQENK